MKVDLVGVNSIRKPLKGGGERWYYYHRGSGARLPDDPHSPEFLQRLRELNSGDQPLARAASGGTLAGLIGTYQASPNFRGLARSSRVTCATYLSEIGAAYGNTPLAAFEQRATRGELLLWRDRVALKSPSTAQQLIANFRRLLSFAVDRGLLEQNILSKVKSIYQVDRSGIIWTDEQVKAVLAAATPAAQRVIRLALYTGQRQGDLIAWKWSDYQNEMLHLRQSKTGSRVTLPVSAGLAELLASFPRQAETILTNTLGRPWIGCSFRLAFVTAMRAAGLGEAGLHFHDFRGTAITVMADAGMSEAQIAAVTGHNLAHVSQILRKYLKRTNTQAEAGLAAIGNSWIGKLQT